MTQFPIKLFFEYSIVRSEEYIKTLLHWRSLRCLDSFLISLVICKSSLVNILIFTDNFL